MKHIFTLSWRNFVAYKKIYIKMIVALVALLFLITLFCSFTVSLKNKQNFYLYQNISSNYTYGERPLQAGEIKEKFDTLEVKRVINEQFNVAVFGENYDRWYTPSQWLVVDYDNKRYFFDDDMLDFEPYVANGIIMLNDVKEANGAELMIGRYPQKSDEIVLSEQWLAGYGLTRDVIGKRITLRAVKFVGEDGEYAPEYIIPVYPSLWKYEVLPFKAEFTVCGILTNEYSALGGRSYVFSPNVLVTEDNVLASYGLQTEYVCSLDEWASSDTVKYLEDQDGIYYCGENSVKMMDLTVKMRLVSDRLALYFGSALIFAVVFTLIMLIGRLSAAQMKNSGELLISGLTDKQLFGTWIMQFAISALIALIAAIGLTVGALYAINAILYNGLAITITVSISDFAVITVVGLVIVAAVSVSALLYVSLRFRRKQTRELLDT